LAALRVRKRIFEVLRLGTPIRKKAIRKAGNQEKTTGVVAAAILSGKSFTVCRQLPARHSASAAARNGGS
jgi:hypothetical protein